MKPTLWILPVLLLFAPGAGAEEGAPLPSREECRKLLAIPPAAGGEYRAGEGVKGRKVAPADLDHATRWRPPEETSMDVRREGKGKLGDMVLGKITLRGNRVYLDGHPLGDTAVADLVETCREAYGERR